jgi:hypothetical protein
VAACGAADLAFEQIVVALAARGGRVAPQVEAGLAVVVLR